MSLILEPRGLLFFGLAFALLLAGHIIRAARLTALFSRNSHVRRFDLLVGLALGYCVNTLLPARLGELVRTLYVGKRCHIRYAYVGATVIGERLSDAVFLGLVCLGLLLTHNLPFSIVALIFTVLMASAAGIALGYFTKRSRWVRSIIWKVASLFNNNICYAILDLVWSFSEIVTGGMMLRARYLLLTVIMWGIYGSSYMAFGMLIHAPLANVVYTMLGSPLHPIIQSILHGNMTAEDFLLLAFDIIPLVAILAFGLLREQKTLVRVWSSLLHGRFRTWNANPSPVSEHFKEHSEYLYFLTSLFAEDDQRVSGFALSAIEDGVVHRLFHGGSGAITAMVEADGQLMIRKFAIGGMKDKLKLQVDWLRQYQADLPLVEILGERMESSFYRYDMPYPAQANDFYDVIHTAPIEHSRQILTDVVTTVNSFHGATQLEQASDALLDDYLRLKVIQNTETVLSFISDVIRGDTYRLNGRDYSLADWRRIQDPAWLRRQIGDRRMSQVHGDLTIENIIVNPAHPRGWYLIDPNPGNIFDSPFIDWAKLRQSLHLGYEGLNRAATCTWKGSELSLALTRSHAYDQLNETFEGLIADQVGPHAQREVSFHELVNYLRLTPYKIRQSPTKGLAFFACTSLLLGAYLEQYD